MIQLSRLLLLSMGLAAVARGQVVIPLNDVIGATGTNAATIYGAGNAVNLTGVSSNSGVTTLTAAGSAGSSSFDFNTGFGDSIDRTIGSSFYGGGNVFANQRYDGVSTNTLVLDTNFNGDFVGEDTVPLPGFGMHADTFITFDLEVIRANAGLATGTTLYLTGIAGLPAPGAVEPTSAAIIVNGVQRAVFDFNTGAGNLSSSFNLTLAGTTRYLTFAALSGVDSSDQWAHIAFGNIQLSTVPEPGTALLLGGGLALLGVGRWHRRRLRRE